MNGAIPFFGPESGTLAAWVSAIATFGGVTWALILYYLNRRTTRKSGVTNVYCRYDHENKKAIVGNLGDYPIANVEVFAGKPPKNQDKFPLWIDPRSAHERDLNLTNDDFVVSVQFVDRFDQHWKKDSDGNITRLNPNTPIRNVLLFVPRKMGEFCSRLLRLLKLRSG